MNQQFDLNATTKTLPSSPTVTRHRIREGRDFPLGATWDGLGVNFALFSAHATKVELCLFDDAGKREIERIELPEYTDEVWHGYLPGRAARARSTAIACTAPTSPTNGHRFNPNKLLLDPYAQGDRRRADWDHALFGYTIGSPDDDLTFDERDSAPFMPKCRVIDPAFTWGDERRPRRAVGPHDHLRDRTCAASPSCIPAVPESLRGTFAGLGRPGGGRLHPRARRHRGRAAADPHLRRRQLSARQGADATTGATTRSASSRPTRATAACPTSASPSSRRWWRACTTPASR